MIAHLIVSTIVLAIALTIASLPRLSARTRFAVLMIGLAKLLVPSLPKQTAATIALPMPRIEMPAIAAAAPGAAPFPWIETLWLAVAAILILRSLMLTLRTNAAAIRGATPPSPRELEALRVARERTGVQASIDLIRSSISEAPAVVRVLRPVIVLPAGGTDSLTDDELVSLLCHECAHVARRDNLLGVAEAIVCSAFWFHPLVWLAHSRIAIEREKACDEIAADSHEHARVYATALTKVCRSMIAPPIAGISCIASTNLKSRLESIMRYPSLRPVSHRAVAAAAVAVVLMSTLAFAAPSVPASSSVAVTAENKTQTFTGEPISLRLKDADLRDVLRTFGQITGLDFVVADGIEGKVTIEVENRPWDEVLSRILTEQGLQHRIEGKKIYITR